MPEDQQTPNAASESESVVPLSENESTQPGGGQASIDMALADAPPEFGGILAAFLGRQPDPFLAKFNEEHLHKVLDYREAHSQRQDRQAHSARRTWLVAAAAIVFAALAVFLALVFLDENDLASEFFAGIIGLVGGGGLGYGLGRRR